MQVNIPYMDAMETGEVFPILLGKGVEPKTLVFLVFYDPWRIHGTMVGTFTYHEGSTFDGKSHGSIIGKVGLNHSPTQNLPQLWQQKLGWSSLDALNLTLEKSSELQYQISSRHQMRQTHGCSLWVVVIGVCGKTLCFFSFYSLGNSLGILIMVYYHPCNPVV